VIPVRSFENANALHQLRCGGVLEAVRISCAGFPSKRPFPDFVEHFWPLAPELYHRPELDDRCGVHLCTCLCMCSWVCLHVCVRVCECLCVYDCGCLNCNGGEGGLVARH
jgi:hypothetical protein